MKRMLTLAMIGAFIGLVIVVAVGCGGGSVTGPSDEGAGQGSVGTPTAAAVPAPAATPSPAPADTTATGPYVEFNNDGSGKFCNPMTHVGAVTITYTKELDLREIYGTPVTYRAEPGKCVAIPPAISVIMPEILPTLKCGQTWKKRVQQDANNGEQSLAGKHLGHVFVDVEFSSEACCVESEETKVEVSYGEWGECKPITSDVTQSTVAPECRKARTVTTTSTTTYAQCQKKEPLVVVETKTEYVACECKVVCVPEEKIDIQTTYSEWGECKPANGVQGLVQSCQKQRVATTTTTTTYAACENKKPLVVVTTKDEFEACECTVVCIPEEKVDVKVTYSEWGECTADRSDASRDEKCYQSRVKTTTTTTTYAQCQDKEPKVEVKTETEKRDCECEVQCEVTTKKDIVYCIPLLGNEREELDYLNGLGYGEFKFSKKYEDVSSPWSAPKDFDAVLLKSGSCNLPATGVNPTPNGTEYRLYLGVDEGDTLEMSSGKDISHASVFTLECE